MSNNKSDCMEETIKVDEFKYIQQHLANERTFLAWIRTAIAIIGVGFLVTNLHFSVQSSMTPIGDLLANIIGLLSVGVGIITIIMSIISYIRKTNCINNRSFRTSKRTAITLGVFVILIAIVFGAYFLIL